MGIEAVQCFNLGRHNLNAEAVQSLFKPRFFRGADFLSTPLGFLTAGDAESPVLCWASALLLLTALAPPDAVSGIGLQQRTAEYIAGIESLKIMGMLQQGLRGAC